MDRIVELRNVIQDDLPIFFEHQRDPLALAMTDFPAREEEAFMAHWRKIMADENTFLKTILCDGQVAGNILSFDMDGKREVGYWLGRDFWGMGIASEALTQVLGLVAMRPLYAHVSKRNRASRRVLEKCGFIVIGEDVWEPLPGEKEIEEYVLELR
ncbi:MAG: GNAT family N-acetyltransferase [Anaerolineales bacterium]|nr:GNAT family N-acetyltransferase [Anaerolineales bacterium]